jgi:hypothetical protein
MAQKPAIINARVPQLMMWVPESRSRVLSCEFVEKPSGHDSY